MSAWPEATYIINKINDSLIELGTFEQQLENINNANQRLNDLEDRADRDQSDITNLSANIDTLTNKASTFETFINDYQESDVSSIGAQIETLEDNLQEAANLIAFIDEENASQSAPKTISTSSTRSIWFILED